MPINYHMLSDFRGAHEKALEDLLTQIVAAMMAARLVKLQRVAQDGMRVRASAGAASFRRKQTLEQCLQQARDQVEHLAKEREHPDPGVSQRKRRARERAAKELKQRVDKALQQLPALQAAKERQARTKAKAQRNKITEARVSTTDPDARVMKMPDGGFRPAYNVEFATDVDSRVIVGVAVINQGTDAGQAVPMEQQMLERTGKHPEMYLMDGGLASHDDIVSLEQQRVEVYAPLRPPRTKTSGREPTTPRATDPPEIVRWRTRMGTDDAKEIYKDRAATAEWANAQCRTRYGVRQFTVRGLAKTLCAMLLVVVTHNLVRWLALAT